jgi:hypothetical protein
MRPEEDRPGLPSPTEVSVLAGHAFAGLGDLAASVTLGPFGASASEST